MKDVIEKISEIQSIIEREIQSIIERESYEFHVKSTITCMLACKLWCIFDPTRLTRPG